MATKQTVIKFDLKTKRILENNIQIIRELYKKSCERIALHNETCSPIKGEKWIRAMRDKKFVLNTCYLLKGLKRTIIECEVLGCYGSKKPTDFMSRTRYYDIKYMAYYEFLNKLQGRPCVDID